MFILPLCNCKPTFLLKEYSLLNMILYMMLYCSPKNL